MPNEDITSALDDMFYRVVLSYRREKHYQPPMRLVIYTSQTGPAHVIGYMHRGQDTETMLRQWSDGHRQLVAERLRNAVAREMAPHFTDYVLKRLEEWEYYLAEGDEEARKDFESTVEKALTRGLSHKDAFRRAVVFEHEMNKMLCFEGDERLVEMLRQDAVLDVGCRLDIEANAIAVAADIENAFKRSSQLLARHIESWHKSAATSDEMTNLHRPSRI